MSTVLVVDDQAAIRFTLRAILEDDGVDVLEAEDGEAALRVVEGNAVDLIITDLMMPGLDGMGLLRRLGGRPPVVMITAHGSERQAVQAIKAGALDYFTKPLSANEISRVVRRCMTTALVTAENARLRAGLALRRTMVFQSQAMLRVAEMVERVGPRDVTVLLTGESGTGKELVARALVAASARAGLAYVRFNCGALPRDLAESELFGHTRSAFTGANSARRGLFRQAHRGTLLLDEIGDLAPAIQASLLRVLQERVVRPVGSDRTEPVDVRIIAATNHDLSTHPSFRSDLFYRLNVVAIHLPPLRDRPHDIEPLARHFVQRAVARYGLGHMSLTADLLQSLRTQRWPGNVRELENTIERLVVMSDGPLIDLERLDAGTVTPMALRARVAAFERGLIADAMQRSGGNRSAAARELGVNRVTLIDKLKKYGLGAV